MAKVKPCLKMLKNKKVKRRRKHKKKRLILDCKREKFCQLFVSENKEFFGNGVQSYLECYKKIDKKKANWYKTACAAASRLLSNDKVCARINELLEKKGFNNENVDRQLLYLINQYSDNTNKLGAIREYNKLKQRITDKIEKKEEITHKADKTITGIIEKIYGQSIANKND